MKGAQRARSTSGDLASPGRGTSAWVCFSWEPVPVSGPIPLGASSLQRLNLPFPRKEKKIAQNKKPDPDASL